MIDQQHHGYLISGTAVPGPPYTTYWNPSGSVLIQRDNGSTVELTRFMLQTFDLDDDGVAQLFGLELARLVGKRLGSDIPIITIMFLRSEIFLRVNSKGY